MRSFLDCKRTLIAKLARCVSARISWGTRLPVLFVDGRLDTLTGLRTRTKIESFENFHDPPDLEELELIPGTVIERKKIIANSIMATNCWQ